MDILVHGYDYERDIPVARFALDYHTDDYGMTTASLPREVAQIFIDHGLPVPSPHWKSGSYFISLLVPNEEIAMLILLRYPLDLR